jgi:hypothetical protein
MVRMENTIRLVTRHGECFEVNSQGKDRADNRDGVLHYFYVTDNARGRGLRRVSVFRGGPRDFYASSLEEFDRRIDTVLLNRLRRGFDSGELTFDLPESDTFKEIRLRHADFQPQPSATDEEIRQLIMHEAYWLSYRYGNRNPVMFDSETDSEYLAVGVEDIRRNKWVLEEEGLLERSPFPGSGRLTGQLVKMYEARQRTVIRNEQVFPKGTQYEAFKAVANILQTATKEIFVVDNYLASSLLDMIAAIPSMPAIKLLTFKASADFKVAVTAFKKQYGSPVEVRLHQKEVHDRAIVIDDRDFFALGASIKDLGDKLSLLNKIEDATNIIRLRTEFQTIWGSATPL